MRTPTATAIAAAVCVVGLAVAGLQYWRRDYFVSAPRTYATLKQARNEGVIDRGWLPDFLPLSATNIHEKHNSEQNTVIASFSFDPATDLAAVLRNAEELPASAMPAVRPPRIGGKERWFPEAIFAGKLHQLAPPGFRLWRIRYKAMVGKANVLKIWHLAINEKAGVCYLWYFVRIPVQPQMEGSSLTEKGFVDAHSRG